MEDTYLKDNIKKCVDYVMSKNDDDKRRILNGMFQYNDYLINEQLVVKALNDEEKQEWFNNEIFEAKDKEIERLNNIIKEAKEYIESRARKAGVRLMPREIELLEILNKGESND